MAQLVKTTSELWVSVSHGRFIILDDDGLADEPDGVPSLMDDEDERGDEWFRPAYNGVDIDGPFSDYDPDVVLELWDGPPPERPGWARTASGEVFFSSGRVHLNNIFGDGDSANSFNLGEKTRTWSLRCHARPSRDDEEEFLLQFWPTPF
ncbi:hypothetical protein [Actinocorallia sp. A-T 12471]|uniref:hypothetical protein n=1 Tax=Actinocorallia sp. A-T 12471 TaxID=3089813 RepID=UPI0029D2E207|nr:hypothetical protein [Actinocorallia sp. A-T 12471]MDX6745127.1 hypothetical protein [Actinocorallia sp. A-T 12471]